MFGIFLCRYQSGFDVDCVEYLNFITEIESIFTKDNLEKFPQEEVIQFKPNEEWAINQLSADEEDVVRKCMLRIAEKVKQLIMHCIKSVVITNEFLFFFVLLSMENLIVSYVFLRGQCLSLAYIYVIFILSGRSIQDNKICILEMV